MKINGYAKSEKLKSKTEIDLLFKKGKWVTVGNIRMIYAPSESSTKLGVSVSKRYFKKAVHRNRAKRLLREAYRLDKGSFKERFGENVNAMIFWVSPILPKNLEEVQGFYDKLCKKK